MSEKDIADRKRVQRWVMRIISDMKNLRNAIKWNRIGLSPKREDEINKTGNYEK